MSIHSSVLEWQQRRLTISVRRRFDPLKQSANVAPYAENQLETRLYRVKELLKVSLPTMEGKIDRWLTFDHSGFAQQDSALGLTTNYVSWTQLYRLLRVYDIV